MNINWIKITKVGTGAAAKTASVQTEEEAVETVLKFVNQVEQHNSLPHDPIPPKRPAS